LFIKELDSKYEQQFKNMKDRLGIMDYQKYIEKSQLLSRECPSLALEKKLSFFPKFNSKAIVSSLG